MMRVFRRSSNSYKVDSCYTWQAHCAAETLHAVPFRNLGSRKNSATIILQFKRSTSHLVRIHWNCYDPRRSWWALETLAASHSSAPSKCCQKVHQRLAVGSLEQWRPTMKHQSCHVQLEAHFPCEVVEPYVQRVQLCQIWEWICITLSFLNTKFIDVLLSRVQACTGNHQNQETHGLQILTAASPWNLSARKFMF